MSAVVGMHDVALRGWGVSSTMVSKLPPDMTIREAAGLIGSTPDDVTVVSAAYVRRIYDLWQQAGDDLTEAKASLEEAKAVCRDALAQIQGERK